MNIMVQAVACGLTNIVTFMWANSETDVQFRWLNVLKGHHGSSGGYFRQGKLIRYNSTFTADATKDQNTGPLPSHQGLSRDRTRVRSR